LFNHIHIVSFNVPSPPNYGGVIDVYYKLKHLHELGIKIHLHCFVYNRLPDPELNNFCEKVYYYDRNTNPLLNFCKTPYIVLSRKSEKLLNNLLADDAPILFEGMHSCYYINNKKLKDRLLIYRESNIEHNYYMQLCKAESKIYKKLFYFVESLKLKRFEKQLSHSKLMFAVSKSDYDYLQDKFPDNKVVYLPSFHANNDVMSKSGKGDYVLYHGNLSVAENEKAAIYLIANVFEQMPDTKFVIAGLNPSQRLKNKVATCDNIKLVESPDSQTMQNLIANAQIHIMFTFQATGLKLKLLNTLYSGRYVICNDKMLSGTGLEDLCITANNPTEIISEIDNYTNTEFSVSDIEKRKAVLSENYSNKRNAEKLVSEIKKVSL
jgi:hypothetical protein